MSLTAWFESFFQLCETAYHRVYNLLGSYSPVVDSQESMYEQSITRYDNAHSFKHECLTAIMRCTIWF